MMDNTNPFGAPSVPADIPTPQTTADAPPGSPALSPAVATVPCGRTLTLPVIG